jgi:hypothetical protein
MAIVNHSHRSYVWGAILAAHDRIRHDIEFLYIGALLHDIGFAEPQRTGDGRPCCFTLTGANAALELGARFGWDEQRREGVRLGSISTPLSPMKESPVRIRASALLKKSPQMRGFSLYAEAVAAPKTSSG